MYKTLNQATTKLKEQKYFKIINIFWNWTWTIEKQNNQ